MPRRVRSESSESVLVPRARGVVVRVVLARPVVQPVRIDAAAEQHEVQNGEIQHRLDDRDVQVIGRHDPSLPPRAVPVVEAMLYMTVLDFMLLGGRINPDRLDDRPGEYDTDYHPSSPRDE